MDIGEEEKKEVMKVMDSGMLTSLAGDVVENFEKEFAEYIGVKHAIAVNSGTAALHASIAALDVDWDLGQVYTKTLTANSTLTFSKLFVGTKDLEITGNYTLGLPSWLAIIDGEYIGTIPNLIQILVTNDQPGSESGWCTINHEF